MIETFKTLHPVLQALLATLFTWGMTALGAALVYVMRSPSQKVLDLMLGIASGVMIAASYWSLLAPAIEMSENHGSLPAYVPALVGFLAGGAALWVTDKLLPHIHPDTNIKEGVDTSWQRSTLLVLAITLHNIPEGLAIGVAFGAVAYGLESASLGAAVALALGIGIQNLPEGTAVSMPLRREGSSRHKAFFYGQFSGMVEPMAGVLGAAAVIFARPLLPYALAFAAGAMIYVVVEELVPASKEDKKSGDIPSIGVMVGFAIMMTLDVALG